jgi:Ca2+/Na+ antiporter
MFLHGQMALYQEVSAVKLSLLKINFKSLYYIVGLLFITALGVLRVKTWAKYVYFLTVMVVVFFTVRIQMFEMSKLSMLLLFFYVIAAYYFYNFLKEEVKEACYVPGYSEDELFNPMLKKIKCEIQHGKENLHGYLTNWNDHSCFIKLNKPFKTISQDIKFVTKFNERTFMSDAYVVSKTTTNDGVGLYFYKKEDESITFGWKDFYMVLDQFGLSPEMLK